MNAVAGCKGCQSSAGAAGCHIHSGQANDLICAACGYKGPASGHGSCSTQPATLIARLRERVEKLEGRVDLIHRVFHVSEGPKDGTGPVAPAFAADGDLLVTVGEIVEAWKRMKAANEECEKHQSDWNMDPAIAERRSTAMKVLSGALDKLETMTVGT